MLTSAILKFDVAMTTTPNVLTTELRDLLYNQCIDNTCCYSMFVYPMGRIRVCKIRFVSTDENGEKNIRYARKGCLDPVWTSMWDEVETSRNDAKHNT